MYYWHPFPHKGWPVTLIVETKPHQTVYQIETITRQPTFIDMQQNHDFWRDARFYLNNCPHQILCIYIYHIRCAHCPSYCSFVVMCSTAAAARYFAAAKQKQTHVQGTHTYTHTNTRTNWLYLGQVRPMFSPASFNMINLSNIALPINRSNLFITSSHLLWNSGVFNVAYIR